VQQEGGKDPEEANQYVEQLKNEKRYKRDVY
jgi:sulfite reductase alpha subunit-like flavoprotein